MVQAPNPTRQPHHHPTSLDVIIFGNGPCASQIASNLDADGISAWQVAGSDKLLKVSPATPPGLPVEARLTRCHGFPGAYDLELIGEHGSIRTTARAVVIAETCRSTPNLSPYGLTPGPAIVDISTLESMLASTDADNPVANAGRVIFLCGWQADSHPIVARRMLEACYQLQERLKVSTYFLTGNLKVMADGAEKRVQAAKRSGAVFLKFDASFPSIVADADRRFNVTGVDELSGESFRLDADWVVVDETIAPSLHLDMLIRTFGIDRDRHGFAQADNVRRMNNATNRRGIVVAGGGRGILSTDDQLIDADQASLAVLDFLEGHGDSDQPAAVVHTGRCARCLTCYRLCPHQAIDTVPRISIVSQACEGCGICWASCPAHAIEMEGVSIDDRLQAPLQTVLPVQTDALRSDHITVFACSRSAVHAIGLTHLSGRSLPAGLQVVEVPCGGTIATGHILAAFDAGADGVMVCPCHTDNCHSQTGNRVAGKRVAVAQDLLQSAGIDPDRLRIAPLAANMGAEFAHKVNGFAADLQSGLRP